MYQKFHVEMDDGQTFDIDGDERDMRAWEAAYERSFFREDMSFTTITQLAYLAGRRTGVLNGQWPDYETFDSHCVGARGGKFQSAIGNPTRPVATAGSSASLPTGSTRSRRKSNGKDPM